MAVLEANKKPQPKPAEPDVEKEVTNIEASQTFL